MRQHYYAYSRYLILGYSIRHIFLKHLLRFLTSVFTLPATTVFAIATTLQSDRVPAAFCDYSAWSQLATYLDSLAHANTCGLLGNPMPQGFPVTVRGLNDAIWKSSEVICLENLDQWTGRSCQINSDPFFLIDCLEAQFFTLLSRDVPCG